MMYDFFDVVGKVLKGLCDVLDVVLKEIPIQGLLVIVCLLKGKA